MKGLLEKLWLELQSRKFRALLISIFTIFIGYFSGEVEAVNAMYAIVTAVAAYTFGVAGEDGLKKLGDKGA